MRKKIIAFVPADSHNQEYAKLMINSLRKFHSEEELPVRVYDNPTGNPIWWYRSTPIIAKELIKEYETVVKLDADQIITESLSFAFEGDYDVAVVNNSNPKEMVSAPYQFLNIHPLAYVNCGFVVMKSESFIDWWYNICHSFLFDATQMKEQDWLNLMVASGNYKVKRLDEGDSFYGLASKGYWPDIILKDKQLILPKGEQWPDRDKIIRAIHWAGGNSPDKMNYRITFQDDVIERLDELVAGKIVQSLPSESVNKTKL